MVTAKPQPFEERDNETKRRKRDKKETTMTDEEFAARKKFAGEKKASMKRRDLHHDYTERRMYMITLETEGRKPLFGHLEAIPLPSAVASTSRTLCSHR